MTRISNTLTYESLLQKFEDLSATRESWEKGSYKKSNDELYDLLGGCLQLLLEVRKNGKLVKQLNKALASAGFKKTANTSLALKIVRRVFGDCGGRTFTYARVITVAAAKKPEKQSMLEFINEHNGIEEIRKTPKSGGPSPTTKAEQRIEKGEAFIANGSPLVVTKFKLVKQLQPSNDNGYEFVAAVVRRDADNKGSIVFATSNTRIIHALLAEAGKQQEVAEQNAVALSKAGAAAQARVDSINKLVAKR